MPGSVPISGLVPMPGPGIHIRLHTFERREFGAVEALVGIGVELSQRLLMSSRSPISLCVT